MSYTQASDLGVHQANARWGDEVSLTTRNTLFQAAAEQPISHGSSAKRQAGSGTGILKSRATSRRHRCEVWFPEHQGLVGEVVVAGQSKPSSLQT
jgi:hypothetical protein